MNFILSHNFKGEVAVQFHGDRLEGRAVDVVAEVVPVPVFLPLPCLVKADSCARAQDGPGDRHWVNSETAASPSQLPSSSVLGQNSLQESMMGDGVLIIAVLQNKPTAETVLPQGGQQAFGRQGKYWGEAWAAHLPIVLLHFLRVTGHSHVYGSSSIYTKSNALHMAVHVCMCGRAWETALLKNKGERNVLCGGKTAHIYSIQTQINTTHLVTALGAGGPPL